ncbi:aminoglycoside phosphotransferase family protein [Propionivibrio limicola]|uniref:aminoglycoside phosphotransferase family protein n=1 Tax=Propionivibrio limicola TaxID=167645 RepID=UPI0012919471|nr:phosphotransferase [Propionivibrio limicola]
MPRTILLRNWLNHIYSSKHPEQEIPIEPASADASFRRYFRVTLDNGETRIVMDAPPQHEDCRPFLKVAKLFRQAGVHVPEVFAEDLGQGFLLLSDLGNTTYLSALNEQTAPSLYRDANTALVHIQHSSRPGLLPDYDHALLSRELNLFPDWYIAKHLDIALDDKQNAALRTVFDKLLANNLAQPKVFVHRDYHSRNLMVVDGADANSFPANPGILDFQDAVYGPITYDLASLYRDAYIRWEEEQEMDFVIRYWEMARKAGLPVDSDFHTFYRDYEWMGAQRQIKVLGIFARLFHRDGKDGYLKDMPRVMAYLRRTAERYNELKPLAHLLDQLENRQVQTGLTF